MNYYNINQNNSSRKNIIPKGNVQNLPNKKVQYYQSQKKSMPVNLRNFNNDINDYTKNTFDGFKILDNNFSGLQTNNNQGNHRVFNSNSVSNNHHLNKEEEIQGRFDQLQNKINNLQNYLSKIGPKNDTQNNDIIKT